VVLQITSHKEVIIGVDWRVDPIAEENKKVRLRLALTARRMWQEALRELPPGVYTCIPTSASRRRLYVNAGWRPHPTRWGHLAYYHLVPPLPAGGLTRGAVAAPPPRPAADLTRQPAADLTRRDLTRRVEEIRRRAEEIGRLVAELQQEVEEDLLLLEQTRRELAAESRQLKTDLFLLK